MDSTQIFWMQLLTSVVVFGIVAVWYVWPYLTKLSLNSALTPRLFMSCMDMFDLPCCCFAAPVSCASRGSGANPAKYY